MAFFSSQVMLEKMFVMLWLVDQLIGVVVVVVLVSNRPLLCCTAVSFVDMECITTVKGCCDCCSKMWLQLWNLMRVLEGNVIVKGG